MLPQKTFSISKVAAIIILIVIIVAASATGVLAYDYMKGIAQVTESCTPTTITFPNFTGSIALDPKNHNVYVLVNPNSVSVVDDTTNKVIKTITIAGNNIGAGITYNPVNGLIYVTEPVLLGNTTVIDGSTDSVVGSLSFMAPVPNAGTLDTSHGVYYYDESSFNGLVSDMILEVNATTNTVIQNISLGRDQAGYLVYDNVNGRLYSFTPDGWVYSIDPVSSAIVAKINLGTNESTIGLVVNPSSGNIFVTLINSSFTNFPQPELGTISMIDVGTNTARTILHTQFLATSPMYVGGNHLLYFVEGGQIGQLVGIDTQTNAIISNVSVTNNPLAALYDPFNTCIYATSGSQNPNVSVIATS